MDHLYYRISKIIQSNLGIHIPNEKIDMLLNAIHKKSSLIKEISMDQYLDYLEKNPTSRTEEWQVVINALNISETYFLRDTGQFEILEKNIIPSILEQKKSSRRIRIWSAGCSTGEEPYSIAILLSELIPNLSDWDISILATDINSDSLKRALAGEYLDWSFRGVAFDRVQKYFTSQKRNFRIIDSIRKLVQFVENNLFYTNYFQEFDLILCRNVFIYFDDLSKKTILDKFEKALVDNGYLLIGHSEAAHLISNAFQTIQYHKSTVYQKAQIKKELEKQIPLKQTVVHKPPIFPKEEKTIFLKPNTPVYNEKEILEKAKELADLGKVTEAETLTKEILGYNPANHEALFLQGQIYEVHGNWDKAIEIYKKVIFLEPNFLESYLTLSSLYSLLHNASESIKVRKAGFLCMKHNERLKQIYKDKGYHIESLESFFTEESGIWL